MYSSSDLEKLTTGIRRLILLACLGAAGIAVTAITLVIYIIYLIIYHVRLV